MRTPALTLTLSPGEREQQSSAFEIFGDTGFGGRLTLFLPLPFRRGEGRGEGKNFGPTIA